MDVTAAEHPHSEQGHAGTSSGVNIEPGTEDDGWVVPPPVKLEDGTLVQLYKDGEALHAAYNAIKQAKQRICLEVYIFASDETGRAFADLLCEKAQQGLAVFVIYDSFGSIGSDRRMFRKMRRAGVRLEEFHPIRPWDVRFGWRPFNRDHRKLLVIDYDVAWMGGMNIGAEYAGSWVTGSGVSDKSPWRDNAICMHGPSAKYFLRAFAKSWHYITHGGRITHAEYLHGIKVPKNRCALLAPRISSAIARIETVGDLGILGHVATLDSPLRPLLHFMFQDAKKSIQLTMAYFAPDDDLIDALCRAAKRGVKVQLMLPGDCDIHALIIAARSFYEKLTKAGVQIFERQGCVLHAKTMVVDGEISVVGSTNLDYRSIEYNNELSCVLRSREFGAQMQALFKNDICYARRITLKEIRRRPVVDRFVQWLVSRARYLL